MAQHHIISIAEALAPGAKFDALIDVRSPAEFAEDHMPGALNWPVLDNRERHEVGLLYAQSPFEARKMGAALVARNIANHLETHAKDMPKHWQPLVYCWRGGQRSGAMNWFLGQVGFRSRQLQGGYKSYRAHVRTELDTLPAALTFTVLCGKTGSGKTRLLQGLADLGAQVLDLEALAAHRGSVLGAMPGCPQPSQKGFESLVWQQLRQFDPAQPVFVESESRKVGQLRVPEHLHERMRLQSRCIWIEMPAPGRVQLLLQDYAHFCADAEHFCTLLEKLVPLRGRERVTHWQSQARAARWADVFGELMHEHYDPGYERSLLGHYPQLAQAPHMVLADGESASVAEAARHLIGS